MPILVVSWGGELEVPPTSCLVGGELEVPPTMSFCLLKKRIRMWNLEPSKERKNMKRYLWFILVLILAMTVVACGGTQPAAEVEETTGEEAADRKSVV